nr:uncharacterized protein LOC123766324 [Procambarus clarkii]XP_045611350.1 uncharacterized protein LOC123766324 [Procambarus clarkii]
MESDTDTSFHHRAAKYRRIANDVDRDSEDSPPRKVTVSMPRKTAECKLTLDEHQNNMIQESETTSDLGFELNRKGFRRPASLLRNRDENLNDYLVASSPFEKSITKNGLHNEGTVKIDIFIRGYPEYRQNDGNPYGQNT